MFELKVQYENGGKSYLPGLTSDSVQSVTKAFHSRKPVVITDDYGDSVGVDMSKVIYFTIFAKKEI